MRRRTVIRQDEVLGLLDRLVAKSLVTVTGAGTASYRYTLLVRIFAHERLEESGELDADRIPPLRLVSRARPHEQELNLDRVFP
jgi:predicted ATPase